MGKAKFRKKVKRIEREHLYVRLVLDCGHSQLWNPVSRDGTLRKEPKSAVCRRCENGQTVSYSLNLCSFHKLD
jgi:hypothetical protein